MSDELAIVERHMMSQPINLEAVFRDLGIEYCTVAMGPTESGRIEKTEGGGYRVLVNASEGLQRQRFTAAHELAHYLLHRDMLQTSHLDRLYLGEVTDNPSAPFSPSHEVQANKVAANILMPKSMVRTDFQRGMTVDELAKKYAVSPAAMRVRLKSLRLVEP
jgi:hypothetical protein